MERLSEQPADFGSNVACNTAAFTLDCVFDLTCDGRW
jgi:hypothetical protein